MAPVGWWGGVRVVRVVRVVGRGDEFEGLMGWSWVVVGRSWGGRRYHILILVHALCLPYQRKPSTMALQGRWVVIRRPH